MKLIIAGSRDIVVGVDLMQEILDLYDLKPSVIVSGMCRGVDISGFEYARYANLPCIECPADWTVQRKAAGHFRNGVMADIGDVLLLIWDGESKGSANMKKQMEKLGKPIFEMII